MLQPDPSSTMHGLIYFEHNIQKIQPDEDTSVINTDFKENSTSLNQQHHNVTCKCEKIPRTTDILSILNCNSYLSSNICVGINDRENRDNLSSNKSKSFLNLGIIKSQNDFTLSHQENSTFSSKCSNTTELEDDRTLHVHYINSELTNSNKKFTVETNASNNYIELNFSSEKSFATELINYKGNNLFETDIREQDLHFTDKNFNREISVNINLNKYQPPNFELIDNETKQTIEVIPDRMKHPTFSIKENFLNWDAPNASLNLLEASSSDNINIGRTIRQNNIYQANSRNKSRTIPNDEDFVQMFERVPTFEMRFLENKSIYARNPTPVSRGVGFDVAMLMDAHKHFETEDDVNEARKTESEILLMYPLHNENYQRRY